MIDTKDKIIKYFSSGIKDTNNFKITISKPFKFNKDDSLEKITEELNIWLEDVIKNSGSNWIWSHNRWK